MRNDAFDGLSITTQAKKRVAETKGIYNQARLYWRMSLTAAMDALREARILAGFTPNVDCTEPMDLKTFCGLPVEIDPAVPEGKWYLEHR